jgi:predicted ATPase
MVEQFPTEAEERPEFVAHHYTEAGFNQHGADYWQRAGQRAVHRSAHAETIAHLTKGLNLLKTLPDTAERTRQELSLQTAQGAALMAVKGFAAPEVEQAYGRARELCAEIGETPQLFPVLWGLWAFYLVRGDTRTACELSDQVLRVAQTAQDPILLVAAHRALGTHCFFLGDLPAAHAHLDQARALYDPTQHRALTALCAEDSGLVSLCFAAHALWHLGYADQALRSIQDALARARELSHPYGITHALDFAAWLHAYRGEARLTQEWSEAVMELATEQVYAFFLAKSRILHGWALAKQGRTEEGIVEIRQGIAAYQATGAGLEVPHWQELLADACIKAGHTEDSSTLLDHTLAELARRRAEWAGASRVLGGCWEAEIYRLKGEALAAAPAADHSADGPAEKCFHRALEIACDQQAKALELRAAVSLSRLWHRQGKCAEARQLLTEIYGWFTEGFDTPDLKDAKALLDELA